MKKEIKPTYVSFEQATKLSKLNADLSSNKNQWLLAKDKGDISKAFICNDDELESYTQIAEDTEHNVYHCLSIPEQHQVIEWLRVNHNIDIMLVLTSETHPREYSISIYTKDTVIPYWDDMPFFNTPQEAYSEAFDYVLNNLI